MSRDAPLAGRRGRKQRKTARAVDASEAMGPVRAGMNGGRYMPLDKSDLHQIDVTARDILYRIGMANAPPFAIELVEAKGGRLNRRGRLLFPEALIEEALGGLVRSFTLYGRKEGQDLQLQGSRVHTGTGGAAASVIDLATGNFRDSSLADLFDAARITDTMPHIHFFSRPVVARDMPCTKSLDLNTAYASLAGTTKHVMTSISEAPNVDDLAQMLFLIAGSPQDFVRRPFLSLNINHAVPPLRFDAQACETMRKAVISGIPVHVNTFGQVGASSSVIFAASLAQTIAETLAGMILAWMIDPSAKATFGPRPMVVDLRTGGLASGSGEQAFVTAAAVQMAKYYGLADSTIAGATDAKTGDAQSGYEKTLTITLAAQSGCNLITQAAGMHASLSACALESYVIDNDMLGSILRPLTGIDVSALKFAVGMIEEVINSEGHFLGHADTIARMQSDFVYPIIADRRTPAEWSADGALDVRTRAIGRAKAILAEPPNRQLPNDADRDIRARFDIKLPC